MVTYLEYGGGNSPWPHRFPAFKVGIVTEFFQIAGMSTTATERLKKLRQEGLVVLTKMADVEHGEFRQSPGRWKSPPSLWPLGGLSHRTAFMRGPHGGGLISGVEGWWWEKRWVRMSVRNSEHRTVDRPSSASPLAAVLSSHVLENQEGWWALKWSNTIWFPRSEGRKVGGGGQEDTGGIYTLTSVVCLDCQNFCLLKWALLLEEGIRRELRMLDYREGGPWEVEEFDRDGIGRWEGWDEMNERRWDEWRECGLGGHAPVVVIRRGGVFGGIAHPVRKAHRTWHYIENFLIMFPDPGNLSMVSYLSCVLC